MLNLELIVEGFAQAMKAADARRPRAVNQRTKVAFQPGLGPHSESETVRLASAEMESTRPDRYAGRISPSVPYPTRKRQKCDLCIGHDSEWLWCIEVKMLRFLGDNGKPNDNILMHILSPYPAHRSALTDCEKLKHSGMRGRKAILIYGYDADKWPLEPAIEAFEVLANQVVDLGGRCEGVLHGLVHPVHQSGRVFGWEIL